MRFPTGRGRAGSKRRCGSRGALGGGFSALALLAATVPATAQMRFERGGSFEVGPEPSAVAVGDVNRDGVPDVLCLSRGLNRLTVAVG